MRTLQSWSSHLHQGLHFRHRRWLDSIRSRLPIHQGDRHHRCLHCSCWYLELAPQSSSIHRHPSQHRRLRGRGGQNRRQRLPKQPKGRGTKPLVRSSFSFSCFSLSFFVLGCCYTENPLFSLSITKSHSLRSEPLVVRSNSRSVGFNVWD